MVFCFFFFVSVFLFFDFMNEIVGVSGAIFKRSSGLLTMHCSQHSPTAGLQEKECL